MGQRKTDGPYALKFFRRGVTDTWGIHIAAAASQLSSVHGYMLSNSHREYPFVWSHVRLTAEGPAEYGLENMDREHRTRK